MWPYDISAYNPLIIIARGLGNIIIILDGFVTRWNWSVWLLKEGERQSRASGCMEEEWEMELERWAGAGWWELTKILQFTPLIFGFISHFSRCQGKARMSLENHQLWPLTGPLKPCNRHSQNTMQVFTLVVDLRLVPVWDPLTHYVKTGIGGFWFMSPKSPEGGGGLGGHQDRL